MDTPSEQLFLLAAEAFCYPSSGSQERLQSSLQSLPNTPAGQAFKRFVQQVRPLSLSDREELYTRTFDLNPPAAPYIGFQVWGESYQRGAFLAKMNRALAEHDIDIEGELPDHLIPVLRYLGTAAEPLPELREALLPALQRMEAALRKVDPGNPYLILLECTQALCSHLIKEAA